MQKFQLLSPSEQVARHLKLLLRQGRWTGLMPGTGTLAKELPGADPKAVGTALRQLVQEGWLEDRGVGRRRKILKQAGARKLFRLGYLDYAKDGDVRLEWRMIEKFLTNSEVILEKSPKSMSELKWDVPQIARMVESMNQDAWIVPAGSKEVLEWFQNTGLPVYAVFGRHSKLKIDGFSFEISQSWKTLADRLVELKHKRISVVLRKERRTPAIGEEEKLFFERVSSMGIRPDSFSLPDWEETPSGFHSLLDSLFRFTPPTALILPETYLVHSAFQYFSSMGIKVPKDVSLVSMEDCEEFKWSSPPITRISKDFNLPCQAVSKWVDVISGGKPAPKQKTVCPVEFIEGGTLVGSRG